MILLAEDDPSSMLLMKSIFKKMGYSVIPAVDGHEAVQKYQSESIQIIFMDVEMPKLNGIEATRLIRTIEKNSSKHTPIIALTAHTLEEDKQRFLQEGMDDCLSKPIYVDAIRNILKKFNFPAS